MFKYLAICLAGCEAEVSTDISRTLLKHDVSVNVRIIPSSTCSSNRELLDGMPIYSGEAGCGKIIVETACDFSVLGKIRSVQYWMVYVTNFVDTTNQLDALRPQLLDLAWDVLFEQWISHARYMLKTDIFEILRLKNRVPRFCARCIRDGQLHAFSSLDVARNMGDIIVEKTGWCVDLCTMDFEIIGFVMNETVVVGIYIPSESPFFLRSHLPAEVRLPHSPLGSRVHNYLRPSTAYLLVSLASPAPGDILLDCMSGSGAVVVEAAYAHDCYAIGGDFDVSLLDTFKSATSLTQSHSNNQSMVEVSNACCIVLRCLQR
jgi:hypothetical protein